MIIGINVEVIWFFMLHSPEEIVIRALADCKLIPSIRWELRSSCEMSAWDFLINRILGDLSKVEMDNVQAGEGIWDQSCYFSDLSLQGVRYMKHLWWFLLVLLINMLYKFHLIVNYFSILEYVREMWSIWQRETQNYSWKERTTTQLAYTLVAF